MSPPPRYAGRKEILWRIVIHPSGQFVLFDDKGAMIRQGPKPRALSDWALDNGATHVRWAFDLKILEP